LSELSSVRLKKGRWFLSPSNHLLKIVGFDFDNHNVIVHDYTLKANDHYPFDIAGKIFKPAFRIGEVARMLDRKADTLRKYERKGLIPKVKQYYIGSEDRNKMRVYTKGDIYDLVEFFDRRPPPGRPSNTKVRGNPNRSEIEKIIQSRYKGKK